MGVNSLVSWYDFKYNGDSLSQGEILFNCTVLEPNVTSKDFEGEEPVPMPHAKR